MQLGFHSSDYALIILKHNETIINIELVHNNGPIRAQTITNQIRK